MSVVDNPWIGREVEPAKVSEPVEVAPVWSVVAGISAQDAVACRLPVVLSDHHEDIVLVGAHGGAEAEDMSRRLGVATRFRDVDPLAGQVYSRALREIEDRYGTRALEVEQVSIDELSDEEVDQVIPQVPGEDIPVSDVREGREAEKEPVPQWVHAWAEDMRKGQAKAADYYQDLFSAGEVASAQGEANRAHLEADHARADLADAEKGQESEVASPEVDQAKSQVLSAEERERLTQVRRDQIGTEAAKAVELKEVSFPEPAEEAITKAKPTTKVGKAKVARKQAGRAR